jgi:hypothetical protein
MALRIPDGITAVYVTPLHSRSSSPHPSSRTPSTVWTTSKGHPLTRTQLDNVATRDFENMGIGMVVAKVGKCQHNSWPERNKRHGGQLEGAVPVMAAVAAAQTIGCQLDMWKGTAMRTKGGLMRQHLRLNRVGAVASIKASDAAKRNKNLGNFQFASKP